MRIASACLGAALLLAAATTSALAQGSAGNGIAAEPRAEAPAAPQGPVALGGDWYEFSFPAADAAATGCQPADPAGQICTPSSGGNSVFADAPPWTFTAGFGGADLTVTDAFVIGDEFEVFNFGVSMGTTPVVANSGSCPGDGTDPDVCVTDPATSHAVFELPAGSYSITIRSLPGSVGNGAAYFRVDPAQRFTQAIPTLGRAGFALLAAAIGAAALILFRRRSAVP
jgi:hypothetical protein